MSGEPVFHLRDTSVRFERGYALDGVNLEVGSGERVAVIGPSGAGTSSLIAVLNGTLAATEGTVRVLGQDYATASMRELRQVQRRLGTIHDRAHPCRGSHQRRDQKVVALNTRPPTSRAASC